jgi:hypothetical protein
MLHQWLNLIGLSFDFIGVLMLAREWLIAFETEQKESEIAERERRFRPHVMPSQPQNPHHAVFERMREDQRFRQQMTRGYAARSTRRGWFVIAFLFVASGFALQVIGSWPGGFPGLGF